MAPPAGMEMFSLAQALAQPSPSPVIQNTWILDQKQW